MFLAQFLSEKIIKIILASGDSALTVPLMNDAIICDTPDKILAYQLLAMKGALKLETLGMKHSRGSVAATVRRLIGSRTRNKVELLKEYETVLRRINILR